MPCLGQQVTTLELLARHLIVEWVVSGTQWVLLGRTENTLACHDTYLPHIPLLYHLAFTCLTSSWKQALYTRAKWAALVAQ